MNENGRLARFCDILDRRSVRLLCFLVSGVLTGLTLVFPQIGLIEWISLVPMALCLWRMADVGGLRLRALYGWGVLFFWSFGLAVFHWFVDMYPLDFVPGLDTAGAVSVVLLGWLGLSLFQAVQGGLVFVFLALLMRSPIARRLPALRPFFLGGLWAIFEWWLTQGWFGVPWGRLSLGQTELVVGLQTASLFGPYFVTFLLVTASMLVAVAILTPDRRRLWAGVAVSVLVFQYGVGTLLYLTHHDEGEPITVVAVQGNLSSRNESGGASASETFAVYRRYTREAAEAGADLVVWPETALTYTVTEGGTRWQMLSELSKSCEVTILVGAFSRDEEGNQYNSVFCFLPDGSAAEAVYSKRHLVPFGEYVPMRDVIELLLPSLSELVLSAKDTSPGTDSEVFDTALGRIGSILCYDSVFEELTRDSVNDGAQLICLSTNDSWFLDSAAIYMHKAQSQLRAIETGRYVVRSGNTGISAVITPRGEVAGELAPLVEGTVTEEVYLRDGQTLYMVIGNFFVYLWMPVFAVLLGHAVYTGIWWKIWKKREEERKKDIEKMKEN